MTTDEDGQWRRVRPTGRIELRFSFRTTRDGAPFERGREWAAYDFNDDGTITLRAVSSSDAPRVVRDVTYTLREDFTPTECFLKLQVEGRHEGSGWFRFSEGLATGDTHNVAAGPDHQSATIEGWASAFNAHPVVTDASICAAYDHANPERRQWPANMFKSSADPFGRTGPSLAPLSAGIEFYGTAEVETPEGPLLADHYGIYPRPTDTEPLQEVWCLAGTFVLLQAKAGGVFNTLYALTEMRRTNAQGRSESV